MKANNVAACDYTCSYGVQEMENVLVGGIVGSGAELSCTSKEAYEVLKRAITSV